MAETMQGLPSGPSARRARVLAFGACVLAATVHAQTEVSGELRARADRQTSNPMSAGAYASRLAVSQLLPDLVPAPRRSEVGGEGSIRVRREALFIDWHVQGFSDKDYDKRSTARFNEFYLSAPGGGLQLSAGRRVVQWDVGTVFRPNDLVQQQQNRYILPTRHRGRYVLQAEKYGTDASASLVWVNPQNLTLKDARQLGTEESALAAMLFGRKGSKDLYGFARYGRHTGLSVGASGVAVLSDSVSAHASVNAMRRHDAWVTNAPGSTDVVSASPWGYATLGKAGKAMVGASWTGESRQSVIVEYWYDSTTLSNRQWDAWLARTGALTSQAGAVTAGQLIGAPLAAYAGNLAWQDLPLSVDNVRRDTIFLRWAWQPPGPWLWSLDTLYNPADSGNITTAGVTWQGDRLRLDAALRSFGGPSSALAARLPERRTAVLAATWAY